MIIYCKKYCTCAVAESDFSAVVHRIYYRKRFYADALVSYKLAAVLKSFFDNYTCAGNRCARLLGNVDKSVKCLTFGKEIIDYKHRIVTVQKLF